MSLMCGAKAKSTGKPCQLYPCKNGKCYLHGGKSTGAKTKFGRKRQRDVVTKHGFYSAQTSKEKKLVRELIKRSRQNIV